MDFFQIREIIQSHLNEATAQEKDLDPNAKVIVKGTKGMNSKSFTKKFKNMAAADKWMDDNEDDIEVQQVMNEESDGMYRVTVPASDAMQANEVASDRFRGEFSMEGSNVFVFDSPETAEEFSDQLDMNGLESYMESVNEKKLVKKKDDPCWDGYVQAGTKTKDGKEVPNCVPMDEALEEAKRLRKEDDLEKDDDDPCWDGYVQLGTKKKNGKEVPNCVPMDEALEEAQKKYGVPLREKKKNADQLMVNEKESGGNEAYKKFFQKSLDKFGVNSPAELSKEKKKEFFDYVDKNWSGDKE